MWDTLTGRAAAKAAAEKRRKKAGCILVPDDAEDLVAKVVDTAFDNSEKQIEKVKLGLDPLFIDEIGSFENELKRGLNIKLSGFRKSIDIMSDKYVTADKAEEAVSLEIENAFKHFNEVAQFCGASLNKNAKIIFWRLQRNINIGVRELIDGWR